MSIRAYGDSAVIELFEHHLVITRRRPGLLVDGPSAERLIPFSSIKSVEFVRPGLMAHGRIILTLSGDGQNGCIVAFPKSQVRQFEDVLNAVRQAIATPSIERIAMAAAQNRGRIEQSAPASTADRQEVMVAQPELQRENADKFYDHTPSHDDRSFSPQSREQHRSINPTLGGWWRDMPLLGKIIMTSAVCFFLLVTCSSQTPEEDTADASVDPASEKQLSADQMLSDWSEFVTGQASTSEMALTDGTGKPGEFCSATTGETIMRFGGPKAGPGMPVFFDLFSKLSTKADTGYMGAFSFERSSGKLMAIRLIHKQRPDEAPRSVDDMSMEVAQISPGIVNVGGVIYHTCVL